MSITQHPPEVLYADTERRISDYQTLAVRYANDGDSLGAVMATWAADVCTAQVVIWERVMVGSPDPDAQFFDIATLITQALTTHAAAPAPSSDAAGAVAAARAAICTAFEPAIADLVGQRFGTLDHLVGLPLPAASSYADHALQRAHETPAATASAQAKRTAKDCMAVAVAMQQQGRHQDALQQAWQADWSTLEAYLIDAALAVGDEALISVDLRWAFAVETTRTLHNPSGNFAQAVHEIRSCLASSLGPIEGARLMGRFETIS